MAGSKADNQITYVCTLALLIHFAAFTYCVIYPEVRYLLDSPEYLMAGKNLLQHGIFYSGELNEVPRDLSLYSRRPPLYPMVLGLSQVLSSSMIPAVFLQMLLTFLGGYFLWQILKDMKTDSPLLLGLYLIYPAQVMYSQFLMAEILLQFLLFLAVYLLFRFLKSQRWAYLFAMNLAIGMSALCKPVMMLFWLPNLFFHLWLTRRFSPSKVILASMIPLLLFAGWGFRNRQVTGYFHFTSMTASQAMLLTRESREAAQQGEGYAEASQAAVRAYVKAVWNNFPHYARSYAIGMTAFVLDPGRFDFYEFLDWPHDARLPRIFFSDREDAGDLSSIPLTILGILGVIFLVNVSIVVATCFFPFKKHVDLRLRVFVCLIVFYMLVLVGPIGTSRYRLSVEPILIMMAAPALCLIADYLKSRWSR